MESYVIGMERLSSKLLDLILHITFPNQLPQTTLHFVCVWKKQIVALAGFDAPHYGGSCIHVLIYLNTRL